MTLPWQASLVLRAALMASHRCSSGRRSSSSTTSGGGSPAGIRRDREVQKLSGAVDSDGTAVYGCRPAVVLVTELAPHRFPIADRPSKGVPVGTKTITMYVSDLDQSEIPPGQVYQLSIRHPDGATQQLDISEKNYRALKLQDMGKTLKKRVRKPGSNTKATKAT